MQQPQIWLTPGPWPRWGRRAVAGVAMVVGLVAAMVLAQRTALALSGGLTIELNKAEDLVGGCMDSVVFQNNLGSTLD
ncbi:MAG: hypothetical protein V3U44_00960, partial [Alphaproteobacteria bacterium]